jgi:hypothetical protein
MAYIGKQPVVGNFVKLDAITTSATATYNLLNGGVAYFPQTANNCIVSLNGVIQSPTSAYTISGSTIVFSDALTASDSIDFILVLGDVLNIGTPSDSTVGFAKVTSNLITGATAETSIAGGDSVLIYDDSASALRKMTRTNFVSGLSVDNTPSFFAYKTSNQAISANTDTKISFQSEGWDTDTAFDSTTNYRFTVPAGEGGKYFFFVRARFDNGTGNTLHRLILSLNGTQIEVAEDRQYTNSSGHEMFLQLSHIINLSAADYIEVNGRTSSSGVNILGSATLNDTRTFFTGFKLIGV